MCEPVRNPVREVQPTEADREKANQVVLSWQCVQGRPASLTTLIASALAAERERTWDKAIHTAGAVYVYGPSSLPLERERAMQARHVILKALIAAKGREQ